MPEQIDFDNDHGSKKPRGWRDAKRALDGPAADQLLRLEQLAREGGGCPRYLLAVAVHHYLALGKDGRFAAFAAYARATDSQARHRESWQRLGYLMVADRPWPIEMVPGSVCLEGVRVPGHVGNVVATPPPRRARAPGRARCAGAPRRRRR